MQIKIFTVPILEGEGENGRLNAFLRSHKILQVKQQLVEQTYQAYWCFSVRYVEDYKLKATKRGDVDYKADLKPEEFVRFEAFRKVRKKIAVDERVPAFVIFTDKELAGLAKLETLTLSGMRKVKGIGEKKVEKYGHYFIKKEADNETQK